MSRRDWSFTALGFTVLWRAVDRDVLPYPLQYRSTAETVADYESEWKSEAAGLHRRFDESLYSALRVLAEPEARIEMAGFSGNDKLRVHAAVHYRHAVLLVQEPTSSPDRGGAVHMSLIDAAVASRRVVDLLPRCRTRQRPRHRDLSARTRRRGRGTVPRGCAAHAPRPSRTIFRTPSHHHRPRRGIRGPGVGQPPGTSPRLPRDGLSRRPLSRAQRRHHQGCPRRHHRTTNTTRPGRTGNGQKLSRGERSELHLKQRITATRPYPIDLPRREQPGRLITIAISAVRAAPRLTVFTLSSIRRSAARVLTEPLQHCCLHSRQSGRRLTAQSRMFSTTAVSIRANNAPKTTQLVRIQLRPGHLGGFGAIAPGRRWNAGER